MNFISIVPIKYISTRVPGKNYRIMNGKPLYWWVLNTLSKLKNINQIIVNTDSKIIENYIKNDFPQITIYFRPKHLEGGHISTNLLLLDTIQSLKLTNPNNVFIQTHITNPLLSVDTINKCIIKYIENVKNDSLFTVKQLQTRLYNKKWKAINHNIRELIPTQNLDPIYEENSCLYLFNYKIINKYKHRIGKNPYLYVMDDIESSDIDYESDFILTEQLIKLQEKKLKVVVITGSSGGIGSSIVELFNDEKWFTIGIDITEKNNVDMFLKINLSKEVDYDKYILEIIEKYGRIDCLVNNAAIQICKKWDNYTNEDWNNTLNCNLKSCYLLSKSCKDYLSKTGGAIINICSIHCIATSNNIGLYAMSKHALQGLTKSMSLEYIKNNVRINCILPGAIDTPMLHTGSNRHNNLEKGSKIIGHPKDISSTVLHIYNNKFMVGSSLIIDGGASLQLSTE